MSKKHVTQTQLVINVALVGKCGCGKTAILVKFYTNRYIYEYSSLINDVVQRDEMIDGQLYCLNIREYSDSDETYQQSTFIWADVLLIVYSITSRTSYYRAIEIAKLYSQFNKEKKSVAILVANKSDLADLRLVEQSESIKLATELGFPHIECNVVYDINLIRNLFHQSVRLYNLQNFTSHSSLRISDAVPSLSKFVAPTKPSNSVKWSHNKSNNTKSPANETVQKKNSVAFRFFSKKSK